MALSKERRDGDSFSTLLRKRFAVTNPWVLIPSSCGETGIRTPEPLWTVTRFPGVPLQPLEHLSKSSPKLGCMLEIGCKLQKKCDLPTISKTKIPIFFVLNERLRMKLHFLMKKNAFRVFYDLKKGIFLKILLALSVVASVMSSRPT